MQIRTRLTLWFIGITALLLLSSLIFIYINFSNHLKAEFYETLESKAVMTVVMLVKNNPDLETNKENESGKSDILSSKENIIVYNTKFDKLFSFNKEEDISKTILQTIIEKGEFKFNIGMYNAIGIKYKTNSGQELIIVSKGIFLSEELLRLGHILVITFFLFLTITAIAGYYFSGKALFPIIKIMNELDNIKPTNLTARIKVGKNRDEISRLAHTFNKLLDKIEEAFNIQKGFLSNISHELRNPLASIISSIQVTLNKERDSDEYKKCLDTILQDAVELENTSTQLMELARLSSKSDHILFGKTRIDELIWQSMEIVKKSNSTFSFTLNLDKLPENSEKLIINANESLIKTALINLLENACKFSPEHQAEINLFVSNDNTISIEIKDTAPIISQEDKTNIFKPFYRSLKTNNIKGSGIGLSLVSSILNVHHAELKISNNQDQGNIFIVIFKIAN